MELKNEFVGYTDRTLEQQEAEILAKMPTAVPEITDLSRSNPWIKQIRIWSATSELHHYYIDNAAREAFPVTAEEFRSLYNYAKLVDYRIRGRLSASVDQKFYIDAPNASNVTIPAGTVIVSSTGVKFVTQAEAVIEAGQTQVSVNAKSEQAIVNDVIGVTTGLSNQEFAITNNIVDGSLVIVINGVTWFGQDTLGFSKSDDNHFVAGLNGDGLMTVTFGDGVTGTIPATGYDVVASYKTTEGINSNVSAQTITVIESNVTVPSGVTLRTVNNNPALGGLNEEGIELVRRNSILSTRTLNRAVTLDDFIAIAQKAPGVSKAGALYNGGKTFYIYIAPVGGTGIASSSLLTSSYEYINKRKALGSKIDVQSVGIVGLKYEIKLYLKPGFSREQKIAECKQKLAAFQSMSNQDINGTTTEGDVYEVVEGIPGVKTSDLIKMVAVPYARPMLHTTQLSWTRVLNENSASTIRWMIVVSSDEQFQLLKNNTFFGTFNFGEEVDLPEVTFTVDEVIYTPGMGWEFVTYAYNKNLVLEEPSVAISYETDITVTAEGGI